MGLAASQARFLGLTARKSNNEYQAQQINQQRLALASEQEDIVNAYNEKMSNRILCYFEDGDTAKSANSASQLSYWNIVNPKVWDGEEGVTDAEQAGMGFRLVDVNGNIIVPNYPGVNTVTPSGETIGEIIEKYNITQDVLNNTILQDNIKSGTWTMRAKRTDDDGNESWYEIPFDEASFIVEMRTTNPSDDADKEYYRLFNTNVPLIDGQYQELTFVNLTTMEDLQIRIYDENDKIVSNKMADDDLMIAYGQYHVDPQCVDNAYLEEKLRSGEWLIQQPEHPDSALTDYVTTPWQGIANIYDAYNSEDDAEAEAEYETLMARVQKQDKLLEMRLKQLETEHKALETEMDSVSKVLEDNVTKSFKTFSA